MERSVKYFFHYKNLIIIRSYGYSVPRFNLSCVTNNIEIIFDVKTPLSEFETFLTVNYLKARLFFLYEHSSFIQHILFTCCTGKRKINQPYQWQNYFVNFNMACLQLNTYAYTKSRFRYFVQCKYRRMDVHNISLLRCLFRILYGVFPPGKDCILYSCL